MVREGVFCLEFLADYVGNSPAYASLRPIIATQLARLYNRLANPDAAASWLSVALASAEGPSRYDRAVCVAYHELGSLELSRGNYSQARKAYRNALKISRRITPAPGHEIAANLIGLADIAYLADLDTGRTIWLGKLALKHAEAAGEAPHEAEACRVLADALKDDLQYREAEGYLGRGQRVAEQYGLTHVVLSLLTCRAWMAYQHAALGNWPAGEAEAAFRELLQKAQSARDWRYEGDAWSGLGTVAVIDKCVPLLEEAIGHLKTFDQTSDCPHISARRSLLHAIRLHWTRRFAEAAQLYAEASAFSERHGLWSRQADALVGEGAALFHGGRTQEAETTWQQARSVLTKCPRARQMIASNALKACQESPMAVPI